MRHSEIFTDDTTEIIEAAFCAGFEPSDDSLEGADLLAEAEAFLTSFWNA